MAILSGRNLTLVDLVNILDPNGAVANVIEILNATNEILEDMSWMEGNLTDGHQSTIRTGIPAPTWRRLYGGVQPTKGTTAQIKDTCGMLEAYCEVDKKLFQLNNMSNAWRLSEDAAHMEGMNQEVAQTLFYGNEGDAPDEFTGLAPRFNSKSAANGDNIIDAGGTGTDNASIWLVVWGDMTIHGIVPKGSKAGFQMENLGQDTKVNSDGTMYEVLRTHYMWDLGLTVRDWRYVVRIANIDKSSLTNRWNAGQFQSGANLPSLMFRAMRLIPNLSMGRPAFYMSRDIATWVAEQTAAAVQGSTLVTGEVGGDGRYTERFKGLPMRRVDAISGDESQVT